MRLWSLHPRYLDGKGLTAVWREGLLAQAVLRGRTRGYKHHPQLTRFRACESCLVAINAYLWHVWVEAAARGYSFDRTKVRQPGGEEWVGVTTGQVAFEAMHLLKKLEQREPKRWRALQGVELEVHPVMRVREGGVEAWEKG